MASAVMQLELFTADKPPKLGSRGWPLCSVCGRHESIGPPKARRPDLCTVCWSPERDPEGWASWLRIVAEIEAARG